MVRDCSIWRIPPNVLLMLVKTFIKITALLPLINCCLAIRSWLISGGWQIYIQDCLSFLLQKPTRSDTDNLFFGLSPSFLLTENYREVSFTAKEDNLRKLEDISLPELESSSTAKSIQVPKNSSFHLQGKEDFC